MNTNHFLSSFLPQVAPLDISQQALPADLVSIGDYQRHAEAMLHPAVTAYVNGGSADEITLSQNTQAFEQIQLLPRLLQSFEQASTQVNSGGMTLAHPILLGPVAHQSLYHPEAELATATAAAAMKTPMVVSTLASQPLEAIQQAGDSPKWFQLYWQPSRQDNLKLLQRAADAGYEAVVITLDATISGLRNRAERSGFHLNDQPHPNLEGLTQPSLQSVSSQGKSQILHGAMSFTPDMADIEWLRKALPLPLIAKGVLNPLDARMLKDDLGLDGLIVSNHGGRVLDTVPAALTQLPLIRQAVGNDYPLLFDSGIRRGSDIFKAIALGADAVLIGRPQAWALAVAGATGITHMLGLLQHELETCMAQIGCPQLANACPEFLTGQ
ncbi:MAG: alpha-hydroxy acid oxidase [Oceanobacter sp.]